jgi:(1->4)-alpha-D-glucan 1-alpha-D-glucosylmutase
MSSEKDLDRLCHLYGIPDEYVDIRGERHRVTDRTRRAFLAAMGVEARDPAATSLSLTAAEDRPWREALPPVIVVAERAEHVRFPLVMREDGGSPALRWAIIAEGGEHREGQCRLSDLPAQERRQVDGVTYLRYEMVLPNPAVSGYHRLEIPELPAAEGPPAVASLIVTPRCCYLPDALQADARSWGVITQLHAVRSRRNWGIGDFTDLTRLIERAAEAGAGTLGLTPLHSLFPDEPQRCDPYAPSSRLFLNLLHLDVAAIPEYGECEEARRLVEGEMFQARLRALRAAELVDYPAVAQTKGDVLERLYRHFRSEHLRKGTERGRAFRSFQAWQGESLRRFCLFHALREHLVGEGGRPIPSTDWPSEFRDPESPSVARFAADHEERIDFFGYFQWQGSQQLQGVGKRSWELGLTVGLYQDLAAGVTPDGADAWADGAVYARNVQVGAPPDDFSPTGQSWGLLPLNPVRLREAAYAPFIACLRQNMRNAGALRIDHVIGLQRLYWIPEGMDASEGGYVAYPLEEMLGILALESQRNRCLVVGEDLGTVPPGLREALEGRGILCSRVLYFEREESGGFAPPASYEPLAVASIGTHDLPPLEAFWEGTDLETRRTLGLYANEAQYQEAVIRRATDRSHLLLALQREGLLPGDTGADPVALAELPPALVRAVHLYLARSPSQLMLVQLEDAFGQSEQVNLPGSRDAYPNWQRRLPLDLEEWGDQAPLGELLAAVCQERGPAVHAPPVPPSGDESFAPARAEIPRATYRLQLHAGFTFADAAAVVPYLSRLGISHCYLSPYLKARPGSTHGYDVVAHDQLNPELGTWEDFEDLCETLAAHGMGQMMDLVPNHVGVMGRENEKWLDVLENGPASRFSAFFDIDWSPLKRELQGKVLLPVLGDHYGNLLDRGELRLAYDNGSFFVAYYEHQFPVDPREYPRILGPGLERLEERIADTPLVARFESLVSAFGNLPPGSETSDKAVTERRRDKELHKQRLEALRVESPDLDWYVHECLREYNGNDQYPADTGRLHDLLEAQAYRLAYWRVAADEINFRRFFDINDLAALRMEDPEAFDAVHRLPFELVGAGKVQGLRIDHPDGLYNPAEYFYRIQAHVTAGNGAADEPPVRRPLYLVAEKILVGDEQLPRQWPVHGTTGYDFAALADGLLVDSGNAEAMTEVYESFAPGIPPLAEQVYRSKKQVMRNLLSSELHVLATELSRIAETDPHTRDYTLEGLRNALTEIVACFPVYRSYADPEGVSSRDQANINRAVAEAKRRSNAVDLTVFDFVREVLIERASQGKSQAYRDRVLRFAMKFQQYTSPVMAKGLEDTAYYRYHRLVSLNEVGGAPERFGLSIDAFHRANQRRALAWPHTLLATSTHDSKRSEDVRARLHALSELPEEWQARVQRWTVINRRFKRDLDGRILPDPNTEYLLYQTLLGAWPLEDAEGETLGRFPERIRAYMAKAIKEAKVHTSWINPNEEYEAAVAWFVDALLDPARNGYFMADFLPFQRRVARVGLFNSLSLTLLRFTVPGVPDTYQGTELWDLSLVDPDNRRPVDFALRASLLEDLERRFSLGEGLGERVGELLETLPDGRAKLYLIWRCLGLRREHPDLFKAGEYLPLAVRGEGEQRLCAFARRTERQTLIAVAPRLLADLCEDGSPFDAPLWQDTMIEVPVPELRNLLTGERLTAPAESGGYLLSATAVLQRFPTGLLLAEGPTRA